MREDAVIEGKRLIAGELALEIAFRGLHQPGQSSCATSRGGNNQSKPALHSSSSPS
jgi:hypothetical protein